MNVAETDYYNNIAVCNLIYEPSQGFEISRIFLPNLIKPKILNLKFFNPFLVNQTLLTQTLIVQKFSFNWG